MRSKASKSSSKPTTATKSQVTILLEEVERQLVDASDEAESIRRISREIASEFQLSLNPRDRVENYELLAHRLKEMAYKPLADVQND